MIYEFVCDTCGDIRQLKRAMNCSPEIADFVPECFKPRVGVGDFNDQDRMVTMSGHGPMRRLYTGQSGSIVMLDGPGYIEQWYRGEDEPFGLTRKQVVGMVNNETARKNRGRRTHARPRGRNPFQRVG